VEVLVEAVESAEQAETRATAAKAVASRWFILARLSARPPNPLSPGHYRVSVNPWTPLVVATMGWALSTVVSRSLLEDGVDPFSLVAMRMGFAMAAMALAVLTALRFRSTGREAWVKGGLLGVISLMIPMVLMTVGLEDVPVSIGGLLIALVPLSTILAAHFLVEDERFNPRSVPGLVLSLVGTGVLVGIGGNDVEGVGNLWRGVAYVTAGVILAGLGGALTRRFAQEVPGESLVLPQFAVAAVAMALILPMLPAEGVGGWSGGDWLQVAVIGVVGTALPHAAFLIGASINSAARLALTGYSVPVVAILLAIVMLGERLTPSVGVGAVMIIGGVVLVERSTVHHPEPGFATSR